MILEMPQENVKNHINKITCNQEKDIDYSIVIQLQQKYGVDYIALTKRLKEIDIISDEQKKNLEEILGNEGELEQLTKKLGRSNELNMPSQATLLLQKDLEILKTNFETGDTTYDDLVRIFGYLGCEPEKFGYENNQELTDAAKDFMKSLQTK